MSSRCKNERRLHGLKGRAAGVVVCWLICWLAGVELWAQEERAAVSVGGDGRLVYVMDERGDRVPDFSHAGYMGGGVAIPDVPVRVVVDAVEGDDTGRIQRAIDYVSGLEPDDREIRGAVLLGRGRFEVYGGLRIETSGVVLRGHGMGEDGTVVVAMGRDRRTLITVSGEDDRVFGRSGDPDRRPAAPGSGPAWGGVEIVDGYVPVNATRFRVRSGHGFEVGDSVIVRRPSTEEWIAHLGMHNMGGDRHGLRWRPGSRDLVWDRTVVGVEGDLIEIDVPITTAMDEAFGGGTVERYEWPGRIRQVGVEGLRLESAFDPENPKDEDHAWLAIVMENVEDAWVRQVTGAHFAGGMVALWESVRRVTVEDCISLAPVSEIGGHRRHTFFTAGQQTLFQRCWSEHGRHDFAVGNAAAGPNAFVQCEAYLPYEESGAIDSWASGVLFDNVRIDGHALSLRNRGIEGHGAGWAAANSMLWQCSAAVIHCYSPPGARNWAFGTWGQFSGDGEFHSSNSHIRPQSLYYAQLADRVGREVLARSGLMELDSEGSTSPSIEEAAELTRMAREPAASLREWIEDAPSRMGISTSVQGANSIDEVLRERGEERPAEAGRPLASGEENRLSVRNGWLVAGDRVLVGSTRGVPWWRGGIRPDEVERAQPAVTRFVPGRVGHGFTDDLDEVTDGMVSAGVVALDHNYGLWYDRRRDDHQRVRRMDGNVWPPFYEQPFARSGEGTAWDGLSRYDLTKFNPWYWGRLREFAELGGEKGLVLLHQHFFQHNILEAGAHWADSPWRTANNTNETGFPEPPHYAGDKRVFMAEHFYDVSHPVRRELYRGYIRQCLEAFSGRQDVEERSTSNVQRSTSNGNANVIHLVSAEYTGPVEFVAFWLDVIAEWERETGEDAVIALSATKDVQDAILSDEKRAAVVDVIDIRYWWYQADGEVYAPEGGLNLAPRQHARVLRPRGSSFEQVLRAVREYRERFPEKAVMYSADGHDRFGWAVLMGGGSLANVPVRMDAELRAALARMHPIELPGDPEGRWALADDAGNYLVFGTAGGPVELELSAGGTYAARWLDHEDTRRRVEAPDVMYRSGVVKVEGSPYSDFRVVWLSRK
jgi:hypothetical protein